jgi:hypothetical protein
MASPLAFSCPTSISPSTPDQKVAFLFRGSIASTQISHSENRLVCLVVFTSLNVDQRWPRNYDGASYCP